MEADEVTVVGRHKFSVIFGVGGKKYRTSIVKEPGGNPDWNEESLIHVVNSSDHVFFTVMEKDDVLGHITIPVASLLTVKGVVKKSPLKAHKKCPNPQGELIFQCYVSKQRPVMISPQISTNAGGQLTGFQKLRHNFSSSQATLHKQNKEEKEEKKKPSSLANFNKKLSKSIHDIFHIGRFGGSNIEQQDDQSSVKGNRFNLRFPSLGSGLDSSGRDVPIVTHIVPNMASIHGGTRLVLEGRSLGLGKSDIMELILCGSDLLDSIEFESENRIYVTTKPTSAGKGDLWIETVSGGQNVIKNIFTFVDRTASTPVPDRKVTDTGSISSRGKHSPLSESLADKPPMLEKDPIATEKKPNLHVVPTINIERSSSFNKVDRQIRDNVISGSATLPIIRTPGIMGSSGSLDSPAEKYRKSFQKHTRGASESLVEINKDAAAKKSSEKADLQAEILRLHRENQTLKQENADMKTYIDGLVARVMIHCPEALAAGDDLKPLQNGGT